MTGKTIKATITAREAQQQQAQAEQPEQAATVPHHAALPPEVEAELEKGRANAKMFGTGQPIIPTVTADQRTERVCFTMFNGSTIEMGPPSKPHMLVLPAMFKSRDITDSLEDNSHFTAAKIMQYVRNINGRELPGYIQRWEEAVALMHELGDLGCRAVYENYAMHWPDIGGLYWTETKKNVPRP